MPVSFAPPVTDEEAMEETPTIHKIPRPSPPGTPTSSTATAASTVDMFGSTRSLGSVGSGSTVKSKTLRSNLTRQRKNCDPLIHYEVTEVLGMGSMGTVAKVRKRAEAIGGSARKLPKDELDDDTGSKETPVCFRLPIVGGFFKTCLTSRDDDVDEGGKQKNALVETPDRSTHKMRRRLSLLSTAAAEAAASSRSSSISTGPGFAMKSIHLSRVTDPTFIDELKNEVEVLKTVDHAHIVRAIETFEYRQQIFVVMELCSGGDLYCRDPYTEEEAARIIASVLSAISYMHSKGVAHRDLKYENVLFVNQSPKAEVKLIDFGLSRMFFSPDEELTDGVGTIYTMAPEVFRRQYTKQADLWSVGVIAFMLLSSQMPFYGRKRYEITEKIVTGTYEFKGRKWRKISKQAKAFVDDLLVVNPDERATADEALSSSWLNRRYSATVRSPNAQEETLANESLFRYANYSKLKKMALMVVAHKSTSDEIGILRKVFQKYDTSGDGQLNFDEFKAAVKDAGFPEDDYERVFDAIDINGSREIDYTEFLAATIETLGGLSEERLAEAFDRLDSDDSGYISAENLRELLGDDVPEEEIQSIIKEADLYQDGRIAYAEFLALWEETMEDETEEFMKDVTLNSNVSVISSTMSDSEHEPDDIMAETLASRACFIDSKLMSERDHSPKEVKLENIPPASP